MVDLRAGWGTHCKPAWAVRPTQKLVYLMQMRRTAIRGVLMACVPALGACGRSAPAGSTVRASSAGGGPPTAGTTVWLCRPGLAHNPCTSSLESTVVGPNGAGHRQRSAPARNPRVDCFYVYPTVSLQPTTNANLEIDPQEHAVAIAQASRFSQVCRMYAPMYPQLTLHAVFARGGITAAVSILPPCAAAPGSSTPTFALRASPA